MKILLRVGLWALSKIDWSKTYDALVNQLDEAAEKTDNQIDDKFVDVARKEKELILKLLKQLIK